MLTLTVLVRIVMMTAVRVMAAVVVVVIALTIATGVVQVGTFDTPNASVLATLHHVGPFTTVPTIVVPGLPALQIPTSIRPRLTSSIVPIVLLIVIILVESISIRRLLLLLLLMRRVIVLMLVMVVVLMILRIAISHGIVACRCYRAAAAPAVHQMIRIAGNAIVQRIGSVRSCGGASRRNHNFLVISRVVPLQVRLLL